MYEVRSAFDRDGDLCSVRCAGSWEAGGEPSSGQRLGVGPSVLRSWHGLLEAPTGHASDVRWCQDLSIDASHYPLYTVLFYIASPICATVQQKILPYIGYCSTETLCCVDEVAFCSI